VVAANFVVDRLRKRRADLSLDDPQWAALRAGLRARGPTPDVELERKEEVALLRELWASLGADDRRFVELYYERQLGFDEVADAMNTTVGALYSRKCRVRRKLAAMRRRREARVPSRHPSPLPNSGTRGSYAASCPPGAAYEPPRGT
jgi:RNA polymerase sigma factor (sigma-70 family)